MKNKKSTTPWTDYVLALYDAVRRIEAGEKNVTKPSRPGAGVEEIMRGMFGDLFNK